MVDTLGWLMPTRAFSCERTFKLTRQTDTASKWQARLVHLVLGRPLRFAALGDDGGLLSKRTRQA